MGSPTALLTDVKCKMSSANVNCRIQSFTVQCPKIQAVGGTRNINVGGGNCFSIH